MLEGIKVIEHATYIAAPGCGAIMADWGAEVIKIEPPGGDPIRRFFESIGVDDASNPVFDLDNRGKRSIILDVAKPEGAAIVRQLIGGADIFLTNVRPGGLRRAGLDPETLRAAHPRLIYASLTGFGLQGPDADRPGFDIAAFWARSGMASLLPPKGAEPFPIRTAMGDHITSIAAASGVMAALFARERTGHGRLVEASLLRTALYALGSDMAIQLAFGRIASTRPRSQAIQPIANFFKTRDGRWLCTVPRQGEADWAPFCTALGRTDLIKDPRFATARDRRKNGPDLVGLLDAVFAEYDFNAIAEKLDAANIIWSPMQTPAEAMADPQVRAAGAIVTLAHEDGRRQESPATPIRFDGAQAETLPRAPRPGENTRKVLEDLGIASTEIDRLIETGIAGAPV
jgi:crotonobetainyl-CoA:carnitine CoA-transferase CaiB-like acyl-CoA transferase